MEGENREREMMVLELSYSELNTESCSMEHPWYDILEILLPLIA